MLYTEWGVEREDDMISKMATAAAMLVAGTALAGAQDVGGTYRADGTNFDGSRYKGTATIEATSSTTCRIRWDTGTVSEGICMRNQNALAAAYAFETGKVGLVVYEIMADGTLNGVWTMADTNGAGTEVLTPMR
jgi:hypothetical protein